MAQLPSVSLCPFDRGLMWSRVSDQELKRKLDAMRTNYDERLNRLEKGAAPKTPASCRPKP
jgi:hypothetical protein